MQQQQTMQTKCATVRWLSVFCLIIERKASITTIGAREVDLAAHGLKVSGMAEFEFKVLACQDAHVRLMNERGNYTTNFLEIVIGVSDNEYFSVRDEKYGLGTFNVFGSFLDCYSWKFFRICEYDHLLIFLKNIPKIWDINNPLFIECQINKYINDYILLRTGGVNLKFYTCILVMFSFNI